jgi:hypothetical protein
MKKSSFLKVLEAILTSKDCWNAVAEIVNIALVEGAGKPDTEQNLKTIVNGSFLVAQNIVEEVKELSK